MGFWQRILTWADPKPLSGDSSFERYSGPTDIVPLFAQYFGPGAQFQPDAQRLLLECVGIPKAATRAIVNRIKSLDLHVMIEQSATEGVLPKKQILNSGPLYELLQHPHPNFTRQKIMGLVSEWVLTVGEGYLQKIFNGLGKPTELHPIPPQMITPAVKSNIVVNYIVTDANGAQKYLAPEEVIRIFNPDPKNPWRAEGHLGPAGIAADTHKFASQHLRAHYQNDATPRLILESMEGSEKWETPEVERFMELWRQHNRIRGGTRQGLPVMLPYMMHAVQLAAQSGMDIAPVLQLFREDLLMTYSVPAPILGRVVSGDRSSAETLQWIFDRYAVLPLTSMIEEDFTEQLAIDFDSKLRVRFDDFVSEDKSFKLMKQKQDLELKVRSINQVREDDHLEAVPWGDDPVGTDKDVPYDPEAAAARVNRPPAAPADAAPQDSMAPGGNLAKIENDLHAKIRILAAQSRPDPGKYASKSKFMEACVPMAVHEGRPQDQAVAMCSSMWEQHKKKGAA